VEVVCETLLVCAEAVPAHAREIAKAAVRIARVFTIRSFRLSPVPRKRVDHLTFTMLSRVTHLTTYKFILSQTHALRIPTQRSWAPIQVSDPARTKTLGRIIDYFSLSAMKETGRSAYRIANLFAREREGSPPAAGGRPPTRRRRTAADSAETRGGRKPVGALTVRGPPTPSRLKGAYWIFGGRARTRTGTIVSEGQILSLLCLPFHHAARARSSTARACLSVRIRTTRNRVHRTRTLMEAAQSFSTPPQMLSQSSPPRSVTRPSRS
jgi:hypothetical protein